MLKACEFIGDVGVANVDFEGGVHDRRVGVIEELQKNVEHRRLRGDELLKSFDGRRVIAEIAYS